MGKDGTSSVGSDFTPAIKRKARELAFFKCCYCFERQGHEVHHLLPKEEGGAGDLDNAILLCTLCHSEYGHRADKRQQLRQARDHWYQVAAKRFAPGTLGQIASLDALATKNDLAGVESRVTGLFEEMMTNWRRGSTTTSEVIAVGSSMINSITPFTFEGVRIGDSGLAAELRDVCGNCSHRERSDAFFCSACGSPLR